VFADQTFGANEHFVRFYNVGRTWRRRKGCARLHRRSGTAPSPPLR